MEALPTDLLRLVLGFLSRSDALAMRCVSRRFRPLGSERVTRVDVSLSRQVSETFPHIAEMDLTSAAYCIQAEPVAAT